ncbi:MAG: cyclomaltodextrinase N-terminal domain-containing protein, partial [Flavobacteriales bacterium]|nr:cyclomaltodextrinase N-terminal domain-containing protein [Flavobacteriales bacterium]
MNMLTTYSQVQDDAFIKAISGQSIDDFRVDPPYWWTDMKNHELEILIYGEGIGASNISLNSTAASIIRAERAMNENYIFITLKISEDAKAGELNFQIVDKTGNAQTLKYALREKSEMAFG